MFECVGNGSQGCEKAQAVKTTATKADGTRNLNRLTLSVAPLNPDMKAWEALQMVRHSIAIR
jgi:hypothetical protein